MAINTLKAVVIQPKKACSPMCSEKNLMGYSNTYQPIGQESNWVDGQSAMLSNIKQRKKMAQAIRRHLSIISICINIR